MTKDRIAYGLGGLVLGAAIAAIVIGRVPYGTMMQDTDMHQTMSSMTGALEGKSGEEFEKAFLEQMIVHHQGAVAMAEMAQRTTVHPDLKNLANDIVATQNTEIAKMKNWLKEWFSE